MNYLNRLILHNLNMDYKKDNLSYENQTNATLNSIMNSFIDKFKKYFNSCVFILEYTDDILGVITYNILKNIQGIYPFKLQVKGKYKKTKRFINKKDFHFSIKTYFKNKIYINCFNPISYVINKSEYFNDFSNSYSLIEKFTPEQLYIISNFFVINDKKLINKNILELYSLYRICNRKSNVINSQSDIYQKYCHSFPDIKIYNLKGNDDDFKIFDEILNIEKDNLIFYNCPESAIDIVKTNINYYINSRNAVTDNFNINIDENEINQLKREREILLLKEDYI